MFRAVTMDALKKTNDVVCSSVAQSKRQGTPPLDILLVEDNASDVFLTNIALDTTRVPYRLQTLRKGNEVLPLLRNRLCCETPILPDLMMLDLGMPGTNGFDVLEQLAAAPPPVRALPIIILTGYRNFEYLQKTHDLWIAGYLDKPCDPHKLRGIMRGLL